MKPGCGINVVGTGCRVCFRKAGKMKEKGGGKENKFRTYNWSSRNFHSGTVWMKCIRVIDEETAFCIPSWRQ